MGFLYMVEKCIVCVCARAQALAQVVTGERARDRTREQESKIVCAHVHKRCSTQIKLMKMESWKVLMSLTLVYILHYFRFL